MSTAAPSSNFISRPVVAVAAVLVMAVWMGVQMLDHNSAYDYLAADQGHYLFGADRILVGEIPYRDFFWHYGPLSLYSFTAVAAIAGVTPLAFEIHQAILDVISAAICLSVMRKWFGPGFGLAGFLLTSFGWLTSFGFMYAPLEKVALFTLVALWRDPAARTVRYSLAMGVLFGLMQGIKFGTAFAAGAAWLLVDALALKARASGRTEVRRWFVGVLQTGCGFALVQGAWIVLGLLLLGHAAGQFLWPTFHLEWYQSYVTSDTRSFKYVNLGYFLGVQLPFLTCLAVTCVMLAKWIFRRDPARPAEAGASGGSMPMLPALILPLVYAIGCFFLIKHVYNMIAYMWLLVPAVGLGLAGGSKTARTLVVLALLPSSLLIPRDAWRVVQRMRADEGGLVSYRTPRGANLRLQPDEFKVVDEFGQQVRAHAEMTASPGVIIGLMERLGVHIGSGFYALFRLQPATHSPWLFSGAVRVSGTDSEFTRYCNARWLSAKLAPAMATASAGERAEEMILHALPFDAQSNRKILEYFEAPIVSPSGWLYYRALRRE